MKKGLWVDTVTDFFIELGMKPFMHLVEISIFFTKSCHGQTYQNYEQSRQKLGTFLVNKIQTLKIKYSSQKFFLERFDPF